MRKITTLKFLMMIASFIPATSFSAIITYTVEYTESSAIKSVSLKNATLRIRLYGNGSPHEFLTLKTNDKQELKFKHHHSDNLIIEVLSIKGQPENLVCHGTARDNQNIEIDCRSRESKEHHY